MRKFQLVLIVLFTGSGLYAQHPNILISDQFNPNEPCIMMDPARPGILLAAANLNNYYISTDTGLTWTEKRLSSSYGVWGDPVLSVDTNGDFYFFHLSNPPSGNWIDRIVCQKTSDTGQTWTNGTYTGLNGTKAQDKQWAAIDRTNNNIYLTWTQFDEYGSTDPADSSIILFSRSTDGGSTWTAPLRINKVAGNCVDSDSTVEGAVPAVGPNGEIYVAWAGKDGIYFDRSLDQGNTWLANDIMVDPMPGGWDYSIPGILRANGLPVTVCDLSGGPDHGTIYINWSDQRNGFGDTDVWLSKSVDGGNTWSAPVRVNDDPPGHDQFFTWMAVDQVTGKLYFVFYDRREHSNSLTDVYMAVSDDGGNSFVNYKISETPFFPSPSIFFGDYTNIVAHNNIVRPIWTRLHNGNLSIWTALVDAGFMIGTTESSVRPAVEQVSAYPNPASEETYVSFKLHEPAKVSLRIYNHLGQEVFRPLENEMYGYGKHILRIPLTGPDLSGGIYYYILDTGNSRKGGKIIVQ